VLSVPAGLPAGNGVTAPLNTALVDDAPKAPVTH
jgi:hypothetical protein